VQTGQKSCSAASACLFILGVCLWFAPAGHAAPIEQTDGQTATIPAATEAPPLALGEYLLRQTQAGERILRTVEAPVDGVYLLTTDDVAQAAAFTLTVTNTVGTQLYRGPFAPLEIELTAAGQYPLQFDATADAFLSFVMLGQIGALSSAEDTPGPLYGGGFVRATQVDGPRYGTLAIPASPYPQAVNLTIVPETGDVYVVEVDMLNGETLRINTVETRQLRFWTWGGDYPLRILPDGPATAFALVPLLSGSPPALPLEQDMPGVIPANASRTMRRLRMDAPTPQLVLDITDADPNIRLRVFDSTADEQGATTPDDSRLTLDDVAAGDYYVAVERTSATDAASAFTLRVTRLPQTPSTAPSTAPTAAQEVGVPYTGTLTAAAPAHTLQFDVIQPGALVTATLLSASTDINWSMQIRRAADAPIRAADPITAGGQLAFVAPVSGTYQLQIQRRGPDSDTDDDTDRDPGDDYVLLVEEGAVAPRLEPNAPIWDDLPGGATARYGFELREAAALLTILVAGDAAAQWDLTVHAYDAESDDARSLVGAGSDAARAVSVADAAPGLYEVVVRNRGADPANPRDYVLLGRVEALAAFGRQWAADAQASSSANPGAAQQAQGAPDAADAAAGVWIPAADEAVATLELAYARAVTPQAVRIHTAAKSDGVVAVEAFNADAEGWVVLWEAIDAPDAAGDESQVAILQPGLAPVDFATTRIRLVIDTEIGRSAIDAVELIGRP